MLEAGADGAPAPPIVIFVLHLESVCTRKYFRCIELKRSGRSDVELRLTPLRGTILDMMEVIE